MTLGAGCGGGDSGADRTAAERARPPALPKVHAQPLPPPRKLVVKDLKVGSGRKAENGDKLTVRYVGTGYRTGKAFDHGPYEFDLGSNTVQAGWEKGVPGMRIGGQRELIIPPRLTLYELGPHETLIYVVELLEIGPA